MFDKDVWIKLKPNLQHLKHVASYFLFLLTFTLLKKKFINVLKKKFINVEWE